MPTTRDGRTRALRSRVLVLVAAVLVLGWAAYVVASPPGPPASAGPLDNAGTTGSSTGSTGSTDGGGGGGDGSTLGSRRPVAVLVGDQVLAPNPGVGKPIPTALAEQMGWDLQGCYCLKGAGFVTGGSDAATPTYDAWVPDIVKLRPDVVLLESAGNDASSGSVAAREAARRVLTRLHTRLPEATVVLLGPLYTGATTTDSARLLQDALRRAAEGTQATYLDPTGWFPGDYGSSTGPGRDLVGPDLVLPNQRGAQLIVRRTVAALHDHHVPAGPATASGS